MNLGGLLAWEFLLMHWVEVRRWQDYKNFGSVNEVRCPLPPGGRSSCSQLLTCLYATDEDRRVTLSAC